jgi:hypothetical protein
VGDVETLLVKYEQVFNPRLFVVKAYQLKRLIMRCQLCTTARHAGDTVQAGDAELLEMSNEVVTQMQQLLGA